MGALAAGMMFTAGPAGATTGSGTHAAGKSASLARAQATGFAGLHGGQASGRSIGRSRVARTASPPIPTPSELRTQREVAARPQPGPLRAQGPATARGAARPTSARTAGARPVTKAPARPGASTDFDYFRAQNVSPGNNQSGVDEPSVANDGNVVLYTGNWYAAESTDSGHSFTYINPYTLGPTPSLPNGGFCCDQVAIHAASNGITAWGLLYCPQTNCASGDNIIRLAVARNQADLAASAFDYYDFSAQTFGLPSGDWLDYPHFGVNGKYLSVSMNVFSGNSFVASILVKFDLNPFLTGGWSANWVYANQDFTWTPADNSVDSWTYWAATAYENNGLIRVYNWPPNTDYTHVSWNDFGVNFNYEWKDGSCAAPDGHNWCAFDDSRVKTGGEVNVSTVYFMWDAKQGGGFNYPYIDYAAFNVSTGPATSVSESQIWNGSYTWAYPGMGVNATGALGVSAAIGGGTWGYPGSQFLIDDDVSGGWAAAYLDQGSHSNNRWGDFLAARAATTGTSIGHTWIASGFTLHDNGGAQTYPSFYWVGRNRDDPFAPSWNSSYGNSYTEGASATYYTGIFYGPSNCTCDYYAYNYWGDGASNGASLYNYAQNYFKLYGTHAYAEEGSYTTSLYAYDNWGASAAGNGLASVADAALSSAGKTISGAVGVKLSGKVLATFADADPGGTASDYTATVQWGDGKTSSGTIGAGTVLGSHTYATVGTFTFSVTIKDAGGASTVASGKANIGYRPAITSASPTKGTHAGGQTVVIKGTHFTGTTSVKFGTTAATFTLNSSTQITVKTPAHATGTIDIRVTNHFGTSAITTADKYTFT